ncbi:MAG: GDSL-type esterase/lipase family protein [Clostridia bacterium]|nr:GDSL-type esterase/lipase family protein [Clostridia bacterium]
MKKAIWFLVLLCFGIGFSAFLYGFPNSFLVTQSHTVEPVKAEATPIPTPTILPGSIPPNAKKGDFHLLVLGDSLARGTGDEQGKGVHGYLSGMVKANYNQTISVNNQAIDGLRTQGLIEMVHTPGFEKVLSSADMIFISIGGNDARTLQNVSGPQKETLFQSLQKSYLDGLNKILKKIRGSNNRCLIVFLGLYNLNYREDIAENSRHLAEWNLETQSLVEKDPKAVVITTSDLFRLNMIRYMSPDGLHPNTKGYEAIAGRALKVLEGVFEAV